MKLCGNGNSAIIGAIVAVAIVSCFILILHHAHEDFPVVPESTCRDKPLVENVDLEFGEACKIYAHFVTCGHMTRQGFPPGGLESIETDDSFILFPATSVGTFRKRRHASGLEISKSTGRIYNPMMHTWQYSGYLPVSRDQFVVFLKKDDSLEKIIDLFGTPRYMSQDSNGGLTLEYEIRDVTALIELNNNVISSISFCEIATCYP